MTLACRLELELPDWVSAFLDHWNEPLDSNESCIRLAVALSAENLEQQTGGPFGAIVVEAGTNRLLGVGVNLVTKLEQSLAHAEIIALALAQKTLGHWNLGATRKVRLFTSCEPCAMCYGAVPWSGVSGLIWGARKEDAEAAGFDEGDKPADWEITLKNRGITTRGDVLREAAAAVLEHYRRDHGDIYHPERI